MDAPSHDVRFAHSVPSPDSDFDLRGTHLLPLEKAVGLEVCDETVQDSRLIEGVEVDLVSHDVRKFFRLLLKQNGYVLAQLYSPLIVHTTPEHADHGSRYRTQRPHPSQTSLPCSLSLCST